MAARVSVLPVAASKWTPTSRRYAHHERDIQSRPFLANGSRHEIHDDTSEWPFELRALDRWAEPFPRVLHPRSDRAKITPMAESVAASEPEPRDSPLGDAVLDAMRGGLRVFGGIVQMAAGITRVLAIAVLKAAAAAEKAVETTEGEAKPVPHGDPAD